MIKKAFEVANKSYSDYTIQTKLTDTEILIKYDAFIDALIVAFRGSEDPKKSIKDWIANLFVAKMNGYHAGFYLKYVSVAAKLKVIIGAYPATAKIVFTGHSQGGAIAEIAADNCATDRFTDLITFGSPRARSWWIYKKFTGTVIRVINGADIIPYLVLRLFGFKHLVKPKRIGGSRLKFWRAFKDHEPNEYKKSIGEM